MAAKLATLENPNCKKSGISSLLDLDPFFAQTQNLNYKFAKVKFCLFLFS